MICCPGYLDDFYWWDPSSGHWTDVAADRSLVAMSSSSPHHYYYVPPLARVGHGLVSWGSKLYLFGGYSSFRSRVAGEWSLSVSLGGYLLASCPGGYSKFAMPLAGSLDVQECRKCSTELEYILNTDTDACQACPPGLWCFGSDVVEPRLEGSTWVRDGSIYLLTACPAGYRVSSERASGVFDAALQLCDPCDKGRECTDPPCTVCSPCAPGFYKELKGPAPCLPCPEDTQNEFPGGEALSSSCTRCPDKASTNGRIGVSNASMCECIKEYYPMAVQDSRFDARSRSFVCKTCPTGAVCPDNTCALRSPGWYCNQSNDFLLGDISEWDGDKWVDVSSRVQGTAPASRQDAGTAIMDGFLYVHGGYGASGGQQSLSAHSILMFDVINLRLSFRQCLILCPALRFRKCSLSFHISLSIYVGQDADSNLCCAVQM
jgi:hypothetical protein